MFSKWTCLWTFILNLAAIAKGISVSSDTLTCTYNGSVYSRGDAWVDDHVCGVCVCNEYGSQCYAKLEGYCKLNNTVAKAGEPVCMYGLKPYLVGDVYSALDGCNKCLCTERGMQCTMKACSSTGFETPSKEPLYGECQYDGGWYRLHTQWLARDGCNTCFCQTIGNYRGGHVCTTSKCPCSTVNAPVITG
ncbi:kielin/chordin-like protein [Mercenaria mercenaria]|uniref:kielin/chordin-like protein n=1 Tax=Mercenaria mercenaria TaxID=6596 RepID=UPI00234F1297|nr:kielin/chordin-like protein [Mercenaria mercenaria]